MIIKHFEIKKKDLSAFNFFLIYGKNEGLKKEILEKNILNNINGQIFKYDEIEFINNYSTILDEILNKSLFEDKKIIIISRASEKIFKFVNEINIKNISDIKIIINSNLLDKKSKLRSLFEKDKSLVVIPVYEDNLRDLTSIVLNFINKNNIKLSRECINLIVNRASGDRKNLNIELEKIFFYYISNKNISLKNIEKLTNLAENYTVNELANNYLLKNIKNVTRILNENNYNNDDCILIIRTILSKSKKLLNILEKYTKNVNLDEVISSFKPPIFWKDKEDIKIQVKSWAPNDLKNKIYELNSLEASVKMNSNNSLNIVSNFVVNN